MEQKKLKRKSQQGLSRREFIGKTTAAAALFTIVPRHVLGGKGYTAPSDMVNVAGIGLGNQGGSDIQNIATPDVPIAQRRGLPGMLMQRSAGISAPRPERPRPQRREGVENMRITNLEEANNYFHYKYRNGYRDCCTDPFFYC